MRKRRVGVIVGNGLTLSLLSNASELLYDWHPQLPFNWDVRTPGRMGEHLLCNLPYLNCLIAEIESRFSIASDFQMFREIDARIRGSNGEKLPYAAQADTEARHFLSIGFSHFDNKIARLPLDGWDWYGWFRVHRDHLGVAVSFNYDLLLERVLKRLGVAYTRHFDRRNGMLVLKPHGSIDFEMATGPQPSRYPLQVHNSWNDGPIYILPKSQCVQVRREPVLVMPLERSRCRRSFSYRPALQRYVNEAKRLTDLIILGHADGREDRPEVNWLIEQTLTDCNVILANPKPSQRLVADLRDAGRRVLTWTNGPRGLPRR